MEPTLTEVTDKAVLQAFYDKTVAHLVKQGCRAFGAVRIPPMNLDEEGEFRDMCLYRGPNGTKCAAGVHIPDSLYRPIMENKAIKSLLYDHQELKPFFPHMGLAERLQHLHDAECNWDENGFTNLAWSETRDIADEYGLTHFIKERALDFNFR